MSEMSCNNRYEGEFEKILEELPRKKVYFIVEKTGGCNHLICKNQACKYEFCWICLGAWEPHGSSWYNCSRFNEDDTKKARDDQERSRSALQRYLHYYKRYHNHHESLTFRK